MPVLDRSALVESPLADLHAIASELSIDGYRRLRRPDLITAILQAQDPEREAASPERAAESEAVGDPVADAESSAGTTRRRRGRRGRSAADPDDGAREESEAEVADEPAKASGAATAGGAAKANGAAKPGEATKATPTEAEASDETAEPGETAEPDEAAKVGPDGEAAPAGEAAAPKARRSRSRSGSGSGEGSGEAPARSRRSRSSAGASPAEDGGGGEDAPSGEDEIVSGVVELLGNGSGFVRVAGSEPSDEDVYISAAQVKRCELVSGDTISGPKRAPRRSERFASLIRIEAINGRPASELGEGVRFDDLPAALPDVRIKVGSEDPTLKAIEWLTPFGRGSRVTVTGASRAGKSEALRRLAAALVEQDELTVSTALAGVRPEEIGEWGTGALAPSAVTTLGASEDAQLAALEPVVDQARRLAARGTHTVVLIDGLDGLSLAAARRIMAGARNLVDGGSVTLVATATVPVGGETTVIALDVTLASVGRFPALDLLASGTLRPERLVGEAGAEAIARTRAELGEDDDD